MHPQKGTPILYHDQLNVVAKHLTYIKLKDEEKNRKHQKYIKSLHPIVCKMKSTKKGAKLTREILKSKAD